MTDALRFSPRALPPCSSCGSTGGCWAGECSAAAALFRANSARAPHTFAAYAAPTALALDSRGQTVLASALEAFRARVSGSDALRGCAAEVLAAVESALAPWTGDVDEGDEGETPAPVELPAGPRSSAGFSAPSVAMPAYAPFEVRAYAARGDKVFAEAIETWGTWQRTRSGRPLKQYLADNVNLAPGA